MPKMLQIESRFGSRYNIQFRMEYYENGNTAIIMDCFNYCGIYEGVYGKLTVNLGNKLDPEYGFVDINNLGDEILDWIADNELGEDTGIRDKTVFVTYPLYKFNLDKIREYSRS